MIKLAFCYLAIFLLAMLLIEGPVNIKRFFYSLSRPLAERVHTQYNALLGWAHIPNFYAEDMYGPGVYLRTNTQSLRSNKNFSASVPHDRLRVICSGDSFTLGYGVNNDQTWCHRLTLLDKRFEAVNMGQGGYGIDQSYLWYLRDGKKLDHHIHLFAFIEDGITRMGRRSLFGYPKPVLNLDGNTVSVENIPVPESAYYTHWLTRSMNAVNKLRSVKFIREIKRKMFSKAPSNHVSKNVNNRDFDLILKLFENLNVENKNRQSAFIVVLLPTRASYTAPNETGIFLRRELAKRGIVFFDLTEEFRNIPERQLDGMFITEDALPYKFAAGHYSVDGNKYIAGQIHRKLSAHVKIDKLSHTQEN